MPRLIRTLLNDTVVFVAALVILALVTQAGVLALQRAYPAQGETVEVAGRNA